MLLSITRKVVALFCFFLFLPFFVLTFDQFRVRDERGEGNETHIFGFKNSGGREESDGDIKREMYPLFI
jgi:hypothetical protein